MREIILWPVSQPLTIDALMHIAMAPPRVCIEIVMIKRREYQAADVKIVVCETDTVKIKERCQSVRVVIVKHCGNTSGSGTCRFSSHFSTSTR